MLALTILLPALAVFALSGLFDGGSSEPTDTDTDTDPVEPVDSNTGTTDNDEITTTPEDDQIIGLDGDDEITSRNGNDDIRAGDGDDLVNAGYGDDIIFAGAGADLVYGLNGDDVIDGGAGADALHGGAGEDEITGGGGDDKLYGESGNDILNGEGGSDRLFGHDGSDLLIGSDDDRLFGGKDDDILEFAGNAEGAVASGDEGNDLLIAHGGGMNLSGGEGNDMFWVSSLDADHAVEADGPVIINDFNAEEDLIVMQAFDVNPDDTDVTISFDVTTYNADGIEGAQVTMVFEDAAGEVWTGSSIILRGADPQTFDTSAINVVYDTTDSDTSRADIIDVAGIIAEDPLGNEFEATYESNDPIVGTAEADTLEGTAADNQISGREGDDTLTGGTGDDQILGGQGNDVVDGGPGDDGVYGNDGDDTVEGGSGNDIVSGGAGTNVLRGGTGDDAVYATGGDVAHGGFDNDFVSIVDNADAGGTIYGDIGDDVLYAQSANVEMDGGEGADTFWVDSEGTAAIAVINDFEGVGTDRLIVEATWVPVADAAVPETISGHGITTEAYTMPDGTTGLLVTTTIDSDAAVGSFAVTRVFLAGVTEADDIADSITVVIDDTDAAADADVIGALANLPSGVVMASSFMA